MTAKTMRVGAASPTNGLLPRVRKMFRHEPQDQRVELCLDPGEARLELCLDPGEARVEPCLEASQIFLVGLVAQSHPQARRRADNTDDDADHCDTTIDQLDPASQPPT